MKADSIVESQDRQIFEDTLKNEDELQDPPVPPSHPQDTSGIADVWLIFAELVFCRT